MTILEQYIDCMQKGDETALADLFNEYGVLHDSIPYTRPAWTPSTWKERWPWK